VATLGGHQVFFCFAGKDREEIEDVKKKILICVWHRVDEFLVRRDDHVLVVWRFRYRISSAARQKKVAASRVPIASRNYGRHVGTKWTFDEQEAKEKIGGKHVRENTNHAVSRAPEFTDMHILVIQWGARTHRATHRQMGQVSTEDTRNIMSCVILLFPIKRLAILE